LIVMPALAAGIHAMTHISPLEARHRVDGRNKPGHDDMGNPDYPHIMSNH